MRDGPGMIGAYEIEVPQFPDQRGRLAAFERARPLPFTPVRTFVISEVPPGAHRACHVTRCAEFLWMATGACRATIRPSAGRAEDEQRFRIVARGRGLFVPEGVWIDLFDFAPGSIMICMADGNYVARD
jgi:hypothetical protein